MRVLLIDNDDRASGALLAMLQGQGHDPVLERTGEGGFFRASTEAFDVVLLDLVLPGRDGLQILTALRERNLKVPIIVVSSRTALADRVAGLDAGADDYVMKPFEPEELLARMRTVVRRSAEGAVPRLRVADVEMDLITRRVSRGGASIELTVREFELLEYLMRHDGQVVSRETLARDVWRETARSTTLDNVIDTHIARLRRKVDANGAVKLIHTIRGVGFALREGEA